MAKKNDIIQVDTRNVIVSNKDDSNIIPYLFNLDKVNKPNCILCQSEYREEVENIYDEQKERKNYSAIKKTLKNKYNFDISRDALRNHLVRHHGRVNTNISLQEYADEIQQWVNMQGNKVASLKARIAVLEKEYFSIANQSEDIDLTERRKNADCLKKLAETILTYENKLSEYMDDAKPVTVFLNQLTVIVDDELKNIDNLTSKKLLSKVLARLHDSCGYLIDKK